MSCLPEAVYSVYVDGELSPEEARRVEAHLIGCRDCRVLVLGLRDEAALLADALHERDLAPKPAPAAAPERGLAVGLPVSVGLVTAALAIGGYLIETRLPYGLDLLNPLHLKGAYEMAFDLVFLLRDRAPGLIELALSLGAVAGVSALLSVGVGALYRRLAGGAAIALAAALLLAAPDARAFELRHGRDADIEVARDETLRETLVAAGESVQVDGTIEGDLIAAARHVSIRGKVDGNVYVFTRDLDVSGTVTGTIHAIAERPTLTGEVGGSVYTAGEVLALTASGDVKGDVTHFGESLVLDGEVGRDTTFFGDRAEIRSKVGRNLVVHADRLSLRDGAEIEGDVRAALPEGEKIDVAAGAVVKGSIDASPRQPMGEHYLAHYTHARFYLWLLAGLAAAFVFGLVLRALAPWLFDAEVRSARAFFRSLGVGVLVVVATPVAILVAAVTVIGIPVALLGLFVYVTLLYSADILVGALVGRALVGSGETGTGAFARELLLGLALVVVVTHLPFLGPAAGVVALLFGTGLLFERVRLRVSPA